MTASTASSAVESAAVDEAVKPLPVLGIEVTLPVLVAVSPAVPPSAPTDVPRPVFALLVDPCSSDEACWVDDSPLPMKAPRPDSASVDDP